MSESILEEAQRLVHGDRGTDYGHPHTDYACTAAIWNAIIERRTGVNPNITPDLACLMMVGVKLSREAGKPKRDNRTDAAGYLECADMCLDRQAEKGV